MLTLQQMNLWSQLTIFIRRIILFAAAGLTALGALALRPASLSNDSGAVNPVILADTTVEATLCAGGVYQFGGQTLTESGTYEETFLATDGSDSTVTLTLTVLPAPVTPLNYTLCIGEPFIFGGQILTEGGTYTDTLSTPDGCDSILVLNLAYVPFFQTGLQQSICAGDTMLFGGQALTQSGTYVDSLSATGGCDSIVTLVLTVHPRPANTLVTGICEGTFYVFGGDTLTVSGIYVDTLKTVNGCDSILILDLTVAAFLETHITASICDGESYPFGGKELSTAGIYMDSLKAIGGCDSTIILKLSILPNWVTNLEASLCAGDTLDFYGTPLTEAGEYKAVLSSADGCDSTLVLNLSILPVSETTLQATICANESYTFDGQELTTAGTYSAVYPAQNGCDSTVNLTLTLLPTSATALEASICAGDSYDFEGQNLSESGVYTAVLANEAGCDSTVTLTLTVLPASMTELQASICPGATYDFDGQELTESGIYMALYTNAAGCDSTVTLTLTVLSPIVTDLEVSICAGAIYEFDGQELNESGTYTAQYLSEAGCDSTVNLSLTVLPVVATNLEANICAGTVYEFNGQALTDSGTYTAIYTGQAGCDSTVNLALSVWPASGTALEASICAGAGYEFNGQNLTESGFYTLTLSNENGCDSTVTLNLTVLPNSSTDLEAIICAGETYVFEGQILEESGVYSMQYTNDAGCDSTIMLSLTVLPVLSTELNMGICAGEAYEFDGQNLTESGTYTAVYTTGNGCDSTVTLNLAVLPVSETTAEASICAGEVYTFGGLALTETGTYTALLTNGAGCDSTVTLTLTVLPVSAIVLEASVCSGESYTFEGQTITESGVYTAVLSNEAGCDSVITLALTVLPVSNTELEAKICLGNTYEFNGQLLTETGTYEALLTNEAGCDSVVTLALSVITASKTEIEAHICAGETYPFNGQDLTESGTYEALLSNVAGCDSIVTLNLMVLPISQTSIEASICAGTTYGFNGEMLSESGIYEAMLTNDAGCDSTVILTLTVLPNTKSELEASICNGETYDFNGQSLTESGMYEATLTNAAGCDSTVVLLLTVLPASMTELQASICAGESYPFAGQLLTTPGIYTAQLTNAAGCDSSIVLMLTVTIVQVSVTVQANVLTAQAGGNSTFQWIDCTTNQPIAGATSATYTAAVSGTYAVVATQNGCQATSTCVDVIVIGTKEQQDEISWELFPNPVTDRVFIRIQEVIPSAFIVEVFDLTGRLRLKKNLESGNAAVPVDLSALPDGPLFIRLSDGNHQSVTKRLIKTR